jgi:hypothetical protein
MVWVCLVLSGHVGVIASNDSITTLSHPVSNPFRAALLKCAEERHTYVVVTDTTVNEASIRFLTLHAHNRGWHK